MFPTCDPAKDYELWTPTPPGAPGACILGRNYTMQRRRRDSRCLNKADFERTETKETACPCDEAFDTECQFGSELVLEFGECNQMKDVDLTTCPALVGLALFTSRYFAVKTRSKLMTPRTVHVTNLTPGSDNPTRWWARCSPPATSASSRWGWTS